MAQNKDNCLQYDNVAVFDGVPTRRASIAPGQKGAGRYEGKIDGASVIQNDALLIEIKTPGIRHASSWQ
jgi:hypothetical protein